MGSRLATTVLLLTLAASLGGSAVWSCAMAHEPQMPATEAGETVGALDPECESLPLAVLPIEQLPATLHCHAVIPDTADDPVDRLLRDDHAARGPPRA